MSPLQGIREAWKWTCSQYTWYRLKTNEALHASCQPHLHLFVQALLFAVILTLLWNWYPILFSPCGQAWDNSRCQHSWVLKGISVTSPTHYTSVTQVQWEHHVGLVMSTFTKHFWAHFFFLSLKHNSVYKCNLAWCQTLHLVSAAKTSWAYSITHYIIQ